MTQSTFAFALLISPEGLLKAYMQDRVTFTSRQSSVRPQVAAFGSAATYYPPSPFIEGPFPSLLLKPYPLRSRHVQPQGTASRAVS